jgi:hypothetical protein
MRHVFFLCQALVLAAVVSAAGQGLLPKTAVQHASVSATASATSAAAGATVTLFADVTPHPSIHIYAEGAREFTPVSLVITPTGVVSAGTPVYPKAGTTGSPGSIAAVPAYTKQFRIAVPVTVARTAHAGETLTIGGAVNYQACDDRLCYPVTAAPVTWTLTVQ